MKKYLLFLVTLFTLVSGGVVEAQSPIIDMGIFKKPTDRSKLEIRIRPADDIVNGAYSGGIFTVRFPASYEASLSEVAGSAQYGYAFAGPVGHHDGYNYYRYQFSGSVNMVNWEKGKEYPILTLQVSGNAPKNAKFELVTDELWTRVHNGNYYQELNGLELQRQFYVLPLKQIYFTAEAMQGRKVKLNWEYESEATLSHSEVEYSADGLQFTKLGDVPAANAAERASEGYQFIHEKPQSVNYYRLRMVDIDGGAEYSSVRVVNFDDLDADFSVFPNPTAGPLTLVSRNLAKYPSGLRYQLTDNAGKTILFDRVIHDNTNINLSKIAAGAYHLSVQSEKEQLASFKVVVIQH